MSDYHLAQINIGRFILPLDHPNNKEFFDGLDKVNEIAENSKGFVWRLKGDGNDATDIRIYDDPNYAVNMSVWQNLEDLIAFAYRAPEHIEFMRKRKQWFEHLDYYMAFWWIKAGTIPNVQDGLNAIESLRKSGASADGFSLKERIERPTF